ncbi:MAG: M6 family metalloprotease domain-containing protein [Bacteroidales bacterium]|nr:M6 family metalloprotease domain-containing protein [Candidatus Colicola coprequi]
MQRYIFVLLCCLVSASLYAVQAHPESGLIGDEYFHYRAEDSLLYDTPIFQHAATERRNKAARYTMASTFPKEGDVRSIVILVNFTDVKFLNSDPNTQFSNLLNEKGYSANGATGSARDYFLACSNGIFRPTFDVYGPYTLEKDQAYYGANTSSGSINTERMQTLLKEACELAVKDHVDFTKYDENNDGVVDNIFVYYAGYNEADGGGENTIWPHRFAVQDRPTYGGKKVYDYACTSELKTTQGRQSGQMCGIGTFCHEFSHVLGLPDMYHTTDSKVYTVGSWDIMASGNYNNDGRTPISYSAFERFMLGWLMPEQITQLGDYSLNPLSEQKAYLVAQGKHNLNKDNPSPSEFWMLENRQYTGWDVPNGKMPGHGLIISHISYNKSRWQGNTYNNYKPLGFDICEAYFKTQSQSSASDPYPGTMKITKFVPISNAQEQLDSLQVMDIHETDNGSVAFHFGIYDGSGFTIDPVRPNTIMTYMTEQEGERYQYDYSYEVAQLAVSGAKLTDTIVTYQCKTAPWQLSLDSVTWGNPISDTIRGGDKSKYERTLFVRYHAQKMCTQANTTLQIFTSNQTQLLNVSINGESKRPTLIHQMSGLEARDVTPYSFVAQWEEEVDAQFYYLTLYKVKNEEKAYTQGFEKFDTYEAIAATGWSSNFLNVTSSEHTEGRYALLFSATGNQVVSEYYDMPIQKLSVWLSHTFLATDKDARGTLIVESSADSEHWEEIQRWVIRSSASATTKYITIDEDKGECHQLRFTYQHNSNRGGVVMDNLIATSAMTPEYIYQGTEYEICAPATKINVLDLEPNTTYYYQLQCWEDKGCEEHYSPQSLAAKVTTLFGTNQGSKQFTVKQKEDGKLYAFLREQASLTDILYVFDASGQLIETVEIAGTDPVVEIPTTHLVHGKTYLCKYTHNKKFTRKDMWAKFLYW